MIENLLNELYQLDSEYAKGAKLQVNIRLDFEAWRCCKTYFNLLERQYPKLNNFWVI